MSVSFVHMTPVHHPISERMGTRCPVNALDPPRYIDCMYLPGKRGRVPPSVSSRGTKCGWYLARTLTNLLKSATLRRLRNSSNFSLRWRGCLTFEMCSRCDHVMQPSSGWASSAKNALSASIRSSKWTLLVLSDRMRSSFKGRTSPNSVPISAVKIAPPFLLQNHSTATSCSFSNCACI